MHWPLRAWKEVLRSLSFVRWIARPLVGSLADSTIKSGQQFGRFHASSRRRSSRFMQRSRRLAQSRSIERRATFETLEPLQMMSATAVLSGNLLTVTGDNSGNQIRIFSADDLGTNRLRIEVNGAALTTLDTTATDQIHQLVVVGGSGDDTLDLSAVSSTNFANLVDNPSTPYIGIYAGAGNDLIQGTQLADWIDGQTGDDVVHGNGGNDLLRDYATGSSDQQFGDAGNDDLYMVGDGTQHGGDDNDILTTGTGVNTEYGDAGNDLLYGNGGTDAMYGGAGNDTLLSNGSSGQMFGEDGNDALIARYGGQVTLEGGAGNDYLEDTNGNSQIIFGAGNLGSDYIASYATGPLSGTIDFSGLDHAANFNLTVATQTVNADLSLFLLGDTGLRNIIGSAHDDTLTDDAHDNTISGGAGNDTLSGGDGADTLDAGTGTDTLSGGAGVDVLYAGDAGDINVKTLNVAAGDTLNFDDASVDRAENAGAGYVVNAPTLAATDAAITFNFTGYSGPVVLHLGAATFSVESYGDVQLAYAHNLLTRSGDGWLDVNDVQAVPAGLIYASTAGITSFNHDSGAAGTSGTRNLTVRVSGDSEVDFTTSQHLAGLEIDTGLVLVTPGTQKLLVTGSLVIGGTTDAWTGQLDLANNALVISGGGATGTANVSNQIRQGFLGENTQATLWTGLGISSSTAADDPLEVTALGVLQNNLLAANSTTGITTDATPSNIIYSTFGGESVGLNDTLVMFTYFGDVLLEQQVSSNGYFAIDTAWAAQWTTSTSIAGWINGDFDEDGQITSGDYYLIDQAFAHRGPAGSVPDVTLQEDDPAYVVSLRDYFSDPLFGSETLTFAVVSNDNPALFAAALTAGGSINTATGELTLNLAPDANGEATLTLTVTDPTGAQRIFTLHVIVDAVDDAPRLSVIPLLPSNLPTDTPVSVDDQGNLIVDFDNVSPTTDSFDLQFNVGGSNPDAANGSTLSYELIGTTNGATIDSATGDVTQTLARPDGPVNEQLTVRVTRHHGPDPDVSTDRVIDIAQGSGSGAGFMADSCSGCGGDSLETFLPIARPESYTAEDDGTLTISAADGLLKDARFAGAYTSLEVDNPTGITVSHGTLTALADGSLHYIAEVGYYSLVQFQFRILVQPALYGTAAVYSEFVTGALAVKTPEVQVAVSKISHNKNDGVLDDTVAKTTGAYIPVDDDSDAYSLPIKVSVKGGVLAGDKYVFIIPGNVRVFKGSTEIKAFNPDYPFTPGTDEVPAEQNLEFYIKGVSKGTGQLGVYLRRGTAISPIEQIVINTFTLAGAHSVVDNTTHHYEASGGSANGKWLSANDKDMQARVGVKGVWRAPGGNQPPLAANELDVYFQTGPNKGTLSYMADKGYVWDYYNVFIVHMEIVKTPSKVGFLAPTSSVVAAPNGNDFRISTGASSTQLGDPADREQFYVDVVLKAPTVKIGTKTFTRGLTGLQIGLVQRAKVAEVRKTAAGVPTVNDLESKYNDLLDTAFTSVFGVVESATNLVPQVWKPTDVEIVGRRDATLRKTIAGIDRVAWSFPKADLSDISFKLNFVTNVAVHFDYALTSKSLSNDTERNAYIPKGFVAWGIDYAGSFAGGAYTTSAAVTSPVVGDSEFIPVNDGRTPQNKIKVDGDTFFEVQQKELKWHAP